MDGKAHYIEMLVTIQQQYNQQLVFESVPAQIKYSLKKTTDFGKKACDKPL